MLIARDPMGRVAILERVERRGEEPPRHLHNREDKIVYVEMTGPPCGNAYDRRRMEDGELSLTQ